LSGLCASKFHRSKKGTRKKERPTGGVYVPQSRTSRLRWLTRKTGAARIRFAHQVSKKDGAEKFPKKKGQNGNLTEENPSDQTVNGKHHNQCRLSDGGPRAGSSSNVPGLLEGKGKGGGGAECWMSYEKESSKKTAEGKGWGNPFFKSPTYPGTKKEG